MEAPKLLQRLELSPPIGQEATYYALCVRFERIDEALKPEKKTELDGLLWDLAGEICK